MQHIHIISPENGSINEITQDIVQYLGQFYNITQEFGFDHPEIPKETDILLMHYLKPEYVNTSFFDEFNKKILIQPIDGTVIKKTYVDSMNHFDLIITPAEAGKQIMINNKINVPIQVIPNYWNYDIFNYHKIDLDISDDTFVFYHESYGQKRKRIEEIIKGYIHTFSNRIDTHNCILIIKTTEHSKKLLNLFLKDYLKMFKYPAKYLIIPDYLDIRQLRYLWHRANCYVSLSGIEGFCIPLLRMSVLNKPIITIKHIHNGYMDFINNTHLLKSDKSFIDTDADIYDTNKSVWTSFNMAEYEYMLWKVYQNNDINILEINDKYLKYLKVNIMDQYKKIIEH